MHLRMSKLIKQGIAISIAVVCLLQAVLSTIQFSLGNNYAMLGSNEALGSPILDKNFAIEDWNKWEMLTWGVFLSNFPMPLVDDYDSAFNSNSGKGSKGSGYKALQFGSGSDPANSETIKSLLNYAVNQQKSGALKPIYVVFNDVARDKVTKADPTKDGTIREATFKDMFLVDDEKDGDSWVKLDNATGLNNQTAKIVPIEGDSTNEGLGDEWGKSERYVSITTINKGKIPTFYVPYGSSYEKIFDYADGWDAQILTAFIARVACGDFKDKFKSLFNDMWSKSGDLKLYLDCFGNIVTPYEGGRRIVIPASINQHLTATPKINLLSSMLFNGYSTNLSATELAYRARQSESGWFNTNFSSDIRFGGLPAMGSHLSGIPQGMIVMYYDLDTIAYQNYFNGGEASNGTKTVGGDYDKTPRNLHYGKAVKSLFDLDANKDTGNKYIFKIEAANMDRYDFDGFSDKKAGKALKTMITASGMIANITGAGIDAKILNQVKTNNGTIDLFGKPTIIPVQMDAGRTKSKVNSAGVGRAFMNFLYESYVDGNDTAAGKIDKQYVSTLLGMPKLATVKDFRKTVLGVNDDALSQLLAAFVADKKGIYYDLHVSADKIAGLEMGGDKDNPFEGIAKTKLNGKKIATLKFETDTKIDYFPGRLIKAYPISEVMRSVGNVLGVREGTEFSLYSTFIYMTYLEWYGLKINNLNGNTTSDFNPRIFDGKEEVLNVDINSIAEVKTEADKKKEVLNYTYMLLHPTEGREYRNEMMQNYSNNFIYNTYQKIVYGNATSFYSSISSNLATRNATGFLSLDSYSDNFTTAWFMKIYTKIAIILIAVSFILIIVLGLLKGRKVSWYLVAITVVVNTILIIPSSGEITPVVINGYVQNMFKDKMTYWAISESTTNAKLENKYLQSTAVSADMLGTMTEQERAQVVELVKTLNVVYLDRSLMVKTDISRKVTQTQSGNYAEVQKLRSARWMLPMIMRQFTANDGSANYVYVPLGDMYDDISNLYWLYKPEDAATSGTVTGQQQTTYNNGSEPANVEQPIKLADRKSYYPDYVDTTVNSAGATIPYRSEAYYRGLTVEDLPHTYSYILKTNATPINREYGFGGEYKNEESYDAFIEKTLESSKAQSFSSAAALLEQQAGRYNRFDRSTVMQSYGYLWSTENPYHYFYQVVKDSFPSDITLGSLVGKLQGQYTKLETGGEVRTSFMHAGETGYIRDVADLEELFTNMVPYIYEMQLTAGGMDGKSGVLGDLKIENYDIYKNNYKAWLFRSNWATKIMESPEYTKPAIVRDKDGNQIDIKNPTLIDCYPENRPMVFSEAQMHELGLHESELNIVELKAVQVNKDISRRWTMLLNYANVKGITKEVMLRQMATEAITVFNSEFSPKGLLNGAFQMYPTGLDLRAISFDSVMKMLMLNVTRDTTYIYGDTMQNIINNTDIVSAALLLAAAFLCTYIIPLVRNFTMGLIFYLGFVAIIYSLLSSNKQKVKVSCGYLISNVLFLIMTLAYYAVFSVLMVMTTSDAVLTVQSVQVNTGNPVWCIIAIIAASVVYIIAMLKMIDFCFRHYRDMGMEVYTSMAGMITDGIANGIDKLGNKVSSYGNDTANSESSKFNNNLAVKPEAVKRGKTTITSFYDFENDTEETTSTDRAGKQNRNLDGHTGNNYEYGPDNYDDSKDALEIDKEIEKGKRDVNDTEGDQSNG